MKFSKKTIFSMLLLGVMQLCNVALIAENSQEARLLRFPHINGDKVVFTMPAIYTSPHRKEVWHAV